jgi:hypothetical protein
MLLDQYKKAKADVSAVNVSMQNDSEKIIQLRSILSDLSSRINIIENEAVKKRALSLYNKLSGIIEGYAGTIKDNSGRYNNIQDITPHANSTIQGFKGTNGGMAFNTGAVIALTAATGAIYAAVSGVSALLDPVKDIIEKQGLLLDEYIARNINEGEYESRAAALENELETKTFFIQKKTGINVPAAITIAGVIYGTYKILQARGVLHKIMAAIK